MLSESVSIVIPARNEEKLLPACLESIRTASRNIKNSLEIIVVLNRCDDRTEEIARQAGCKIVSCQAKNLAAIRNAGVAAASGELIITLDSDSRMSAASLHKILKLMSDRRYIGGGVWIVPERLSAGILITGLMILPVILKYRVFCGMFFVRKNDFDAIGGFNESLASVEDIDFAVRLKKFGKNSARKYKNFFSAYIVTSCRKFDHFGDWFFVKRPGLVFNLLKGGTQEQADLIWYDFPRN